jgi:hypothetical protein
VVASTYGSYVPFTRMVSPSTPTVLMNGEESSSEPSSSKFLSWMMSGLGDGEGVGERQVADVRLLGPAVEPRRRARTQRAEHDDDDAEDGQDALPTPGEES